jgi:hypothetical protein
MRCIAAGGRHSAAGRSSASGRPGHWPGADRVSGGLFGHRRAMDPCRDAAPVRYGFVIVATEPSTFVSEMLKGSL